MARQEIAIPMTEISELSELLGHIKALNVPKTSTLHIWYDAEEASPSVQQKQKALPTQLANTIAEIKKSGGLSKEAMKEMNTNSKTFREEFWLDE